MDLSDKLWIEKWSPTPYKKIVEGRVPKKGGVGCEDEPISSLWCASLAEAMGERYGEGMRLLDYGCGYARFFNFLTGRLKDFVYFGLEIPNSATKHGQRCVRFAKRTFGADGRGKFGFSGSEFEQEALKEAEVVLLGSVLTHVNFETFEKLFSEFIPIFDKGGAVVFSILLGKHSKCVGPGFLLGMNDFYQEARYTRRQLLDYCDGQKLALTDTEYFQAPLEKQPHHSTGGVRQTIFRVERMRLA